MLPDDDLRPGALPRTTSALAPVPAPIARALRGLGALLALALALRVGLGIAAIAIPSHRLQHFDNAVRGLEGIKMADAVRDGNLARLWRLIDHSTIWPPLFPMLETPVFLLFGIDQSIAVGFMALWLIGLLLSCYAFGLALGGPVGIVTGAVAAVLTASSPYVQVFGSMIMLGIPGSMMTVLALAFYARWRRLGSRRDLILTCIVTALLCFTKYNYAVMLIVPLALNEIGHSVPGRASVVGWARQLRRPSPFGVILMLWLVVLVVVAVRNGGWGYGGTRGQGHGLRLPFLGLFVLLAIRFMMAPRKHARAVADALRRMPTGARVFAWIVALPFGLWLASPTHLKGLLNFAVNKEAKPEDETGLLSYPQWFVREFSPHPALGVGVLVLAAASLLLLRSRRAEIRIAPLTMLVGFAMCEAHDFKSSRFFFTVAVMIWVAAATAVGVAAGWLGERLSRGRTAVASAALACAVLVAGLAWAYDPEVAQKKFIRWTITEASRPVLDEIADVHLASRGSVLIGFWNGLSPALVEWHIRMRPGVPRDSRPKNPLWYSTSDGATLVRAIVADSTIERVLVLDLPRGTPAFLTSFVPENPWLPDARVALDHDPRMTFERERRFPDSGYSIRIYRRRS